MCEISSDFGPFVEMTPEPKLYPLVYNYLATQFLVARKPMYGDANIIIDEVSHVVPAADGPWARMDLAAVCVERHRFSAAASIDTISFEVKTHAGADLASVHEALAHRRFARSSFLVWNRPACICNDRKNYERIEQSCKLHGVGLITAHDPNRTHTYQIRIIAQSAGQTDAANAEFIHERFSQNSQTRITQEIQRLNKAAL